MEAIYVKTKQTTFKKITFKTIIRNFQNINCTIGRYDDLTYEEKCLLALVFTIRRITQDR